MNNTSYTSKSGIVSKASSDQARNITKTPRLLQGSLAKVGQNTTAAVKQLKVHQNNPVTGFQQGSEEE